MNKDDILKYCMDITHEQCGTRAMSEDQVLNFLKNSYDQISSFVADHQEKKNEEKKQLEKSQDRQMIEQTQEPPKPIMDPKKSIGYDSVTCVICGKTGKYLTGKHMATHGLTVNSYKRLYGIEKPLVCEKLAAERREKIKDSKIWNHRTKQGIQADTGGETIDQSLLNEPRVERQVEPTVQFDQQQQQQQQQQ